MAYVNVKDWSVDQVTDWLKGLDNVILPYAKSFLNNGVNGYQLLNLRADDLEHLGVLTLGHQEMILEAVEHLRNLHFELDKENLQMLALRLSCAANSLYKELLLADDNMTMVRTQVMSDVHNIITTIKPLVCWLDRSPFQGDKDYTDNKTQLLQLGFEMATSAHRDIFSEKPNRTIRNICEKLAKMADHIIQEIVDPMILQPASLDLATLKKKEQELGFFIMPNNHAIHQIAEIKYGSPAHGSTKIEEGDEIVQVNYQTVVGWQRKKVLMLLRESPPEIVLTLKKRPRHTKVYGQIYMKPYRLPSKKKSTQPYSRWNENLPSPRLLTIHDLLHLPTLKLPPVSEPQELVEASSSSSDSETPDEGGRMYPSKPRPVLQRRNTITGTTPTSKRPYPDLEEYWQVWTAKPKNSTTSAHSSSYNIDSNKLDDSTLLRDKSVSCSHGLELSPRPTTVIGLAQNRKTPSFKKDFNEKSSIRKRVNFEDVERKPLESGPDDNAGFVTVTADDKSLSVNSLASLTENITFIDEGREITDRTSMANDVEETAKISPGSVVKDAALADVHIRNIIRKFDEQKVEKPKVFPRQKRVDGPQRPDGHKKPVVPVRSATTQLRGRLDKSHSTPAYDLTPEEGVKGGVERKQTVVETKIEKETVVTSFTQRTKFQIEITPIITTEQISIDSQNNSNNDTNQEIPERSPPSTTADTTKLTNIPDVVPQPQTPKTESLPPKPQIYETEITIIPTDVDSPPKTVAQKPPEPRNPNIAEDVPPKPPPRTFAVLNLPKPETPKPTDLSQRTNFEFPELKSDNTTAKTLESKAVSTPTRNDFGGELKPAESHKNVSEKISPTNSIVRAMIYSNKNKTGGKKKNVLLGKRRKVTVNDFSPDDLQGFLYQRHRNKNQAVTWEKRWFVLSGGSLYGFKTKDSPRAACLIFLSGFTVAVANEVKSRSNAFKVYHTGTVFYFSAENQETTTTWIETITAATLHGETVKTSDTLYSETDESDAEKPKADKPPETAARKFGSLKKFGGKKSESSSANASTSLDRKWFFNKPSANTKNSVPVPTPQYCSYRRIRNDSVSTGKFTSYVPLSQLQNVSVPNLTVDNLPSAEKSSVVKKTATKKNYVHYSNPSLCNVNDYGTAAALGNKTHVRQQENENLAGFVTLEELMNRQQEERMLNPHNRIEEVAVNLNLIRPDVVYGEVPIRPKENPPPVKAESLKKTHSRAASDASSKQTEPKQEPSSSCFGKRLGSLKKTNKSSVYDGGTYPKSTSKVGSKHNRSLPRMHKLQENRDTNTPDRSYEMIYCPETVTDVQFAQNRTLEDKMYKEAPKRSSRIVRQRSLTSKSCDDSNNASFLSHRGQKVGDSGVTRVKLKSAGQYTPMVLPLVQDPAARFAFELNLDEKAAAKSGKFKFFSKQTDAKKEKTFLGSPKLHRAIFRKTGETQSSTNLQQLNSTSDTSLENVSGTLVENLNVFQLVQHPDYPGLEYPPVFEPETYSLADPQSNLTLIRKQP